MADWLDDELDVGDFLRLEEFCCSTQ